MAFADDAPLLSRIHGPEDLEMLSRSELRGLAQEIRDHLIRWVCRNGGHLGPNLGMVELTIGLHRVFRSPADTLVFDTGHQTYVHKLLTGRQDLSRLRQQDGLSGYPSRSESAHDVLENSHASSSLSWADGIAREKKRRRDPSWTVAVIGDGALTGGMAWEALNNIAEGHNRRVMIIVNDNDRSYAPTIGGIARHLDALRTSEGYERALAWTKRTLMRMGEPGRAAFDALHGLKAGLKDVLMPQAMFEELGIKYLGPVDGHDSGAVEEALRRGRSLNGPVMVHVITQKGRGFAPAEEDSGDRFHAVGRIHPETGLPVAPARFGWTSVFADEIVKVARERDDVVALTAAMMRPVGLGPMFDEFPDRVIDVGIAEQHAVASAAGMAFAGAHPVFAVYATFLNRAIDQVLMDVGLHREGVTFILDRAGVTGDDGASHNGMWDISLLGAVPGLRLAAPRDEPTLREELREALAVDDAPTVLRYGKSPLPEPIASIRRTGVADVVFENPAGGRRILVAATGALVATAVEAAGRCPGVAVSVVDPRWLIPVSSDLVELAASFDRVVSYEDGLADGGFGWRLRDELSARGVPVVCCGLAKEYPEHAKREAILHQAGLDADGMIAQITRLAGLGG